MLAAHVVGQPDLANEGREPNDAGRCMGDVEEEVAGLGMQVAVVLFRAAMP